MDQQKRNNIKFGETTLVGALFTLKDGSTQFVKSNINMNKIQTLAEYQQLAARTCPDLGTLEKNLVHMNLGIITEIGESLDVIKKLVAYNRAMDMVNFGEELADIAWYAVNKDRILALEANLGEGHTLFYGNTKDWLLSDDVKGVASITLQKLTEIDLTLEYFPMTAFGAVLANVGEELGGARDPQLSEYILTLLAQLCEAYNLDFFQILTNNIAKLQVRYPEKFTNEAALNRDLVAERAELEKGHEDNMVRGEAILDEEGRFVVPPGHGRHSGVVISQRTFEYDKSELNEE
jgi:NTP pyrophosphatase (non-canonical NTP hydrolase)